MVTSHRTLKWIENLADQERSIRAGERVSIDICTTKDEVLSVETATFLRELFYHFEDLIGLFNLKVDHPSLQIRLSRLNENIDGFSLVRNRIRLTLSRPQPGVIQLLCDKQLEENGGRSTVMFSGVIEASFAVFHDVEWVFLGSHVSAEQVARHYLTEFIQVSRAAERSVSS